MLKRLCFEWLKLYTILINTHTLPLQKKLFPLFTTCLRANLLTINVLVICLFIFTLRLGTQFF